MKELAQGVLVVTAIIAMLFCTAYVVNAESQAMVCGDVNGDGEVMASDALRVLVKSVGIDVPMYCNNRKNYKNGVWCEEGLVLDIDCIPSAEGTTLSIDCVEETTSY